MGAAGLGFITLMTLGYVDNSAMSHAWAQKGIYGVMGLGLMAASTTSLMDLRQDNVAALAREMTALRKEAETARSLLETERNYSRARDLADLRNRQLATMSHDIKQPLASLRMTIEAMTRDEDPSVRARLTEAFDYMQDLTKGHLDALQPADAADTPPPEPEDQVDPYPLSLIQDTVGQMFREEAVSKGLRLRIVPSSVQVSVPPLVLMRITSNLVSNAVKYTEAGKVLLGARRAGRACGLRCGIPDGA